MSKRPIAEQMMSAAMASREDYAAKLYDREKVGHRIKAAALNGDTHVKISQDKPHDLQLTEAALTLTTWLEGQGFRCMWIPVLLPEKLNVAGAMRPQGYRALVIDWAWTTEGQPLQENLESELSGTIERGDE